MEVSDKVEITEPLQEQKLTAGRYAVLKYVGPYTGLHKAYTYMFGDWLPKSGEEPKNAPPFELYENSPMDTKPDELITLISVPLK